jgi:hypothetical protein
MAAFASKRPRTGANLKRLLPAMATTFSFSEEP